MPLDNYVTLGKSGLRVSPMCLGAMTFGEDWGWGSSVADTQVIIDRYLERGGNFIDTDDKTYDLLDAMAGIAKALGTTVARVALVWVQSRPGVASTIIGARTLAQLDDNLAALDVRLEAAQVAKLDELSKPTLSFPADFIANGAPFFHGGTTMNGRAAEPWPLSPQGDGDRY
jgi:aryl-alcohol dehydrogenase-like predicted oxidoreductase